MAKVVTYKCGRCGSRIVVTKDLQADLTPVYCCGMESKEIPAGKKKPAGAGKKVSKKKVVKKKKAAKSKGRKK